ncbi:recombinase family protein [Parvularcula sp. LCG005]|uniref:recombinase family protein n=1 Tax=Parvularcula sp. LCG005 TaxID=3078805 RepID=UPI002941ECA2|nr:recombinase family protein [Parvularcula sp. LCG005]WOI53047.1 recombinase family protein [Parvularcula sp. LCG005]
MRYIGYARVSTLDQSLDLQLDALHRAGCQTVYRDEGVSGAMRDREGLAAALHDIQSGDQLVTWRLDRLGRSLRHLIEVVQLINDKGAEFKSLSEAIDTSSAGGRLVFHIFGSMAEFERDLISDRTRAGQQAAKARGVHVGRRPKLTGAQVAHASVMIGTGQHTVSSMANVLRVDRTTLWRALKRCETPFSR